MVNFKTNNFGDLYNFAKLEMEIITDSPLLIKSGEQDPLEESNSPRFLRSQDVNGREVCVIPGSTIKGFLRGNLERLSNYIEEGKDLIRNRFGFSHFNKPKNADRSNSASNIYCNQFIAENPNFELRPQIAIDPKTQSARYGALLNLECVSAGTVFKGSIQLRNWDIKLLGMIGMVLQLANKGLISIGSNKSRGFGKLKFVINKIQLQFLGGENNSFFKCNIYEENCTISDSDNEIQFKADNIKLDQEFPLYDQLNLHRKASMELLEKAISKITNN